MKAQQEPTENEDKPSNIMQQIAKTYRPALALGPEQLDILSKIQKSHGLAFTKKKGTYSTKIVWQSALAACLAGIAILIGLSFAQLGEGYYAPNGDVQRGVLSQSLKASPLKLYFEGQQQRQAKQYTKATQTFKSILESENIEGSIRASAAWQIALIDIDQHQTNEAQMMMKFIANNGLEEYISLGDRIKIWCRITRMNLSM
jgi:hypothetical protein